VDDEPEQQARRAASTTGRGGDDGSAGGRDGDESDRGRRRVIGLDLGRLAESEDLAPAVEYLTAIQTMRGDGGSLLFVRGDDLDAMAEQDGRPVPEFLDRLDQLGVVVSSN
jgi:hypothetical protein